MAEKVGGYSYGQNRFWEILPATLVWITLIGALVLSFVAPVWAIVFIILFDLYWLFRILYFVMFLVYAAVRFRRTGKINWMERVRHIHDEERIHHLIFLPTYKEDVDIIRSTLRTLRDNPFPSGRMFVVLCGEERDHEGFARAADTMKTEFGHVFKELIITEHPKDIPGDIPGKGSNLCWAGQKTAEYLAMHHPNIADEDIVVSAFDVDTLAHEQYFAYLTYVYLTTENPGRASYQPVALFSNNMWSSPAPVRISAFGTTFWLLSELARPDRLWTFSSHSMPWTMLKDVGFWQRDIVSEDSRIFLQAFLHYHGDYRVIPMYIPVSMDTVAGKTYIDSLKALYKQQRRWAFGVEHLPVMVQAFAKDTVMPRLTKLKYLFNHMEGMYTWATAPLLIFFLGWLPLRIARGEGSALVQAAPFTLERLMQLAMVGVFVSATLSLFLLPPRPRTIRAHNWIVMLLQWALLPVTFVVLGAFPAIDAQTRFMLGKYLGFNVSQKRRP